MSEEESGSYSSGAFLIPGYKPYIADVSLTKKAKPFPKTNQQTILSDSDVSKKKKKMKPLLRARSFNPPIPLTEYCIIAHDRWDLDEDFDEDERKCCPGGCDIA